MLLLAVLVLPPRAVAADTFGGQTFYLGDVHAHSAVSGDGGSSDVGTTCARDCGTFADMFEVARDNGLDFAAVADHVNGSRISATSTGYDALIDLALAENDPSGGFVTLPAAEVWFKAGTTVLGHKTLLMFGDDTTLAGLAEVDVQPLGSVAEDMGTCGVITTWATNLEASFGHLILMPHHPAATAPMPTDWSCYDPVYEPVVEVYSEHGNSMGDGEGYDPMWSGETAHATVHDAIDPDGAALRLGFAGGTDKHNSRPGDVCNIDTQMPRHPYGGGLTIVVADESESLSRELIYDAMVEHRTLASTGPLVPVTIEFSSAGAALGELGEDLGLPTDQELDVAVAVPESLAAYVTGVTLVTPYARFPMDDEGAGAFSLTLEAADAVGYVYAAVEIDGGLWYGSAGCDDGGSDDLEYVWTSPSYIDEVAGDLDADGFAWADGDCDDGDETIFPDAKEVLSDGIDQDCDGTDPEATEVVEDTGGDELVAEEDSGDAEAATVVEEGAEGEEGEAEATSTETGDAAEEEGEATAEEAGDAPEETEAAAEAPAESDMPVEAEEDYEDGSLLTVTDGPEPTSDTPSTIEEALALLGLSEEETSEVEEAEAEAEATTEECPAEETGSSAVAGGAAPEAAPAERESAAPASETRRFSELGWGHRPGRRPGVTPGRSGKLRP